MCSAAREELSVSFYRNVQNYSAERIIWLKLIKINKYKTRKNVTEEKKYFQVGHSEKYQEKLKTMS